MRTIAHLSDLHFGTEDSRVAQGLIEDLRRAAPSLVVISGDLTQRARRGQFLAAKEFLSRLPGPQLVLPGNHDVPLYDVVRRFAAPFARYRRHISAVLDPAFTDDELFVAGLNTARSLTWKSGRISVEQIEALRLRLARAGERVKVVVTHHPFIPPPGEAGAGIDLVGRATKALVVLDAYKVDLLLAGHLHQGYVGDTRTHYPSSARSIVSAQAGTAISQRVREANGNAYNWITVERTRIDVEVRAWRSDRFAATHTTTFRREDGAWLPSAGDQPGGVVAPPA